MSETFINLYFVGGAAAFAFSAGLWVGFFIGKSVGRR